jgi:protein involved in polysaccharide export with SLBB domain
MRFVKYGMIGALVGMSASFVAAQARQVSVGGAVKAPQRVAYTPDLTVLSAVNAAGGCLAESPVSSLQSCDSAA